MADDTIVNLDDVVAMVGEGAVRSLKIVGQGYILNEADGILSQDPPSVAFFNSIALAKFRVF